MPLRLKKSSRQAVYEARIINLFDVYNLGYNLIVYRDQI